MRVDYGLARVLLLLPIALLACSALNPDGVALLELKRSLNVTAELQTWNAFDTSPCHWEGITCTSSEFVETIHLPGMKTTRGAVLSPSLGRLGSLTSINLEASGISGTIPAEIGNLTRLTTLDLTHNNLSGTIPAEFVHLVALSEIKIAGNKLEGEIPDAFAGCPNLTVIDVSLNQLRGSIPEVLYKNRMLKVLTLHHNNLTGDIATVVEGLTNSPNITVIDLGFNKFYGALPPSIKTGSFMALSSFVIMYNRITGRIPHWLGDLSKLERLSLQSNALEGTIPSSLGNGLKLVNIFLHSNSLTGPVPPEFGRLKNLFWLDISDTSVSGPIPESLGNCSSLWILVLRNCSLSGTLPASLGNLKNLTHLDLSYNNLEGYIPSTLDQCTRLTYLVLANNRLSGAVPVQLGNCTNLQQILLQNNQLTGGFEFNFSSIRFLTYLSISNNSLTGNIFKPLLTNRHFIYFDANRNNFVGEIQNFGEDFDVAPFLSLRVLMLGHNQLQGRVSSWMWRFPVLQILDLSDNHLSGPFQSDFYQLQGFIDKNVAAKRIDTPVDTIQFNQDLALFIKGSIQKLTLSNWHFVIALNLAENNFSGSIPRTIGELKALVYCNLSRNAFTGAIPQEFGTIPLQSLDLSGNFLEGPIPEEFSALTQLSTLRLANNNLSGVIPSGTQLQGFGDESYLPGNDGLCGWPLSKICTINPAFGNTRNLSDSFDDTLISVPAFVLGLVLGFVSVGATCLWVLHPRLSRSWRVWRTEEYGVWRHPT